MDEPKYSLKPDVRIAPFDSGASVLTSQVYGNGRRLAVTSTTGRLFEFLRDPRTRQEVEEFGATHNIVTNGRDLASTLEQTPFSYFVSNPTSEIGNMDQDRPRPTLLIKCDLLSAQTASHIADYLKFLFSPYASLLVLAFVFAAHIHFFKSGDYRHHHTLSFTTQQWFEAWLGAYAALLFHELGHCAACIRYGCQPGSIGIGLYLVWPVLYADTTHSWILDRWHRAIVDVAGIYFQLLASAICIVIGEWSSNPVLLVVSKSAILSAAINLNPFFRFDGFWLITDLTGIPNIRQATSQFWSFIIRAAYDPNIRKSPPPLLRISPKLQAFFGVYCISSVIFFGNITLRLLRLLPQRLTLVPHKLEDLWHFVASQPLSLPTLKALFVFSLFLIGLAQTILFATRRMLRGYQAVRSLVGRISL